MRSGRIHERAWAKTRQYKNRMKSLRFTYRVKKSQRRFRSFLLIRIHSRFNQLHLLGGNT